LSISCVTLAAIVLASAHSATARAEEAAARLAITGGKVVTIARGVHDGGAVLVAGGKIAQVVPRPGADWSPPSGCEVIDARGAWVVPGFIELHSHVGGESSDLNDMVYPTNPGFRTLETIVPENRQLKLAQAGGVTTALFIPGSGTNMSGFGTLIKTAGKDLDEMLVRFPGALKIAQGGNPERRGGDLGSTRVGMNWLIRNALAEGKAYTEAWDDYEAGKRSKPPPVNPRLEHFRGLFHREYPVLVHTQGYHLVHSTVRILHDEMRLRVIIGHGEFDGFELAPEVAARGIHVMAGPREYRFDERIGGFRGLAYEWHRGGVRALGVNTDAPVIPPQELVYQAAMAVRFGLTEDAALRGLTIHAAEALGVADRVGSLEAGKDADIVVWTGHPLDPRHSVVLTIVNGKVVYDARKEPQRF
jgi:imidazolonepropionase-like amidohydrolase